MHCFARANQHLWLRTFEPTWVVQYINVCSCKADNAAQQKEQLHCPRGPRRMLVDHTSGKEWKEKLHKNLQLPICVASTCITHLNICANPESHGCLKPGTPTGMPPHRNAGNVCTYLRMYAISSRSGGLFGRTYGYRNAGTVLELALTSQMHIIHTYVCQEEIYARKGFLEWHDSCVLLGFSRYLDGVVEESGKLCSMWMDRWDAEPYPLNWMANLLFASWIRYWYPSPHNTPPPPRTSFQDGIHTKSM